MSEIFLALFSPATIGSMVPLVAIGGFFYYRIRINELKHKSPKSLSLQDKQVIAQLNERIANLEAIVTSLDQDLLNANPMDDTQKVRELSERTHTR